MVAREYIQPYLDDHALVKPVDKFVCPLTLRHCEMSEISKGHILNQALNYEYNTTVPVFGQPDSFYGTRVEKGFIDFVNVTVLTPTQMVLAQRAVTVEFKKGGQAFDAFIVPYDEVDEVGKHMPVFLLEKDSNRFFVGVKTDLKNPAVPDKAASGDIAVSWGKRFFPSHGVATMLKAAYLTLFSMIGYKAVYNPSANVLRSVLARYFYDNASREEAPDYFRQFSHAVKVLRVGTDFKESPAMMDMDTLRDKRVIWHCLGKNLNPFAMTLMYRLPTMTVSVTIPQALSTTDIALATRLYDMLMAEDPSLNQTAYYTRYDSEGWHPENRVNLHYGPTCS